MKHEMNSRFPTKRVLASLLGLLLVGFIVRAILAPSPQVIEKSQLLPLQQLIARSPVKRVEPVSQPITLSDDPQENGRLVLRNLSAFWRKVDSFKVRTVVKTYDKQRRSVYNEHVVLLGAEKPNRLFFRYENWIGSKVMISDGTKVRISLPEPSDDPNAKTQEKYYLEGDSPDGIGSFLTAISTIGPAANFREFESDHLIALLPLVDSWERVLGSQGFRTLKLTGSEIIDSVNAHRIEFYQDEELTSLDDEKFVLWIAAEGPPRLLQCTNTRANYDQISFRDWELNPEFPEGAFGMPSNHGYKRIGISFEHSKKMLMKQAPELDLVTLGDKKEKLSDYRGKIVLLDFWETSCGPCIVELPKLEKIVDKVRHEGVELLAVTIDSDSKRIKAAQDYMKLNSKIAKITLEGYRNFRIKTIPHLVVVDRVGVVRAIKDGFVPDLEAWLMDVLEDIKRSP